MNILGKRKEAKAMFVDLRAAFDTVDRSVLGNEKRIKEGLVVRVEDALKK